MYLCHLFSVFFYDVMALMVLVSVTAVASVALVVEAVVVVTVVQAFVATAVCRCSTSLLLRLLQRHVE